MDKVNQYQEAILSLLTDYAQFGKPGPGLETQIIADKERNHFQLLTVGWQHNSKFVYAIVSTSPKTANPILALSVTCKTMLYPCGVRSCANPFGETL